MHSPGDKSECEPKQNEPRQTEIERRLKQPAFIVQLRRSVALEHPLVANRWIDAGDFGVSQGRRVQTWNAPKLSDRRVGDWIGRLRLESHSAIVVRGGVIAGQPP